MFRPFAALLPLALLSSGCGMIAAQADISEVCATIVDREFPGADQQGAIDTDVTYDLADDLSVIDKGSYDLKLERVTLALGSNSGLTDLGGLEVAEISLLPPVGQTLDSTVLVSYTRPAGTHPTSIVLASPSGLDLSPYVSQSVVRLHTHAAGTLPSQPWRATMTACFNVKVKVTAGDL